MEKESYPWKPLPVLDLKKKKKGRDALESGRSAGIYIVLLNFFCGTGKMTSFS